MFDTRCQELAEHFLADEPYTRPSATLHDDRVRALAEAVQEAVEAWLHANPYPPALHAVPPR